MHSHITSIFGDQKSCGLAVHYVRSSRVQLLGLTHSLASAHKAWVQLYGFVDSLYQFCTQVVHANFNVFISVKSLLYPLSTQPIKTTTN